MPPRHAYWTIIIDDQPTAFRAHDAEEILAIFNRLRDKHPSAVMKWFERGKLWDSRDAAREAGGGEGERRWEGPRPDRDGEGPAGPANRGARSDRDQPRRDRNWRPGGEHRDPRQKYKDAKKAKWDRFKDKIRGRWEEKKAEEPRPLPPPVPDDGSHTPPHGDPMRPKLGPRGDRPEQSRGARPEGRGPRPDQRRGEWKPREDRPGGWKPKGPPRDRSESKGPPRDRDRGEGGWRPRGEGSGYGARDRDDRREGWKPKGPPRDRDRGESGWRPKGPPRDRGEGGWKPKGPAPGDRRESKGPPRDRSEGEWKPKGPPRDRAEGESGWRPHPRGEGSGFGPGGDRGPWKPKTGARKPWGSKPGGGKSWGAKPAGEKPWGGKPGGGARKPWGGKPASGGYGGARKSDGRGPKKPFGPPRGSSRGGPPRGDSRGGPSRPPRGNSRGGPGGPKKPRGGDDE